VAPSFVLLRTYEPMTPDEQAAILRANIPRLLDDLDQGAIVVIERSRLRVR
jgi:predicted nuclease of predicted toxin-antitoxin system